MATPFFVTPVPLQSRRASARVLTPRMTATANNPNHPATKRPLLAGLKSIQTQFAEFESLTRPGALPKSDNARFTDLPPSAQTPSQMLGRLTPGCEGTQGVFPSCNFGCKPCYHSANANRVRVDGMHTVTEVARQMATLRELRGATGHCQLIGGEVSLLPPEDHALALEIMRFFGRIPMSFTPGDFDYDYLARVAAKEGKKRFDRIDFAVHFDAGIRGRKGAEHVKTEKDLNPFRKRFVDMFHRLRKEYGVKHYLAHKMTVTPDNLGGVGDALKSAIRRPVLCGCSPERFGIGRARTYCNAPRIVDCEDCPNFLAKAVAYDRHSGVVSKSCFSRGWHMGNGDKRI